MKVPGNPENPAKLSRSASEQATIQLCYSADATTSKVLLFGLELHREGPVTLTTMEDGSAQGQIAKGIIASIGKPSITIRGSSTLGDSTSGSNNHVIDKLNLVVTTNPDAEMGKHMFGVSMFKPDETGVSGMLLIQWVYVDIVE
ncbi:hypothetical protein NVIE_030250 [Nitrososphaera viennensis EN76]|uniref:Uncharacterized protein n=2 Tax=Nitrososphaera viennensis TaxID=1034015 RepID=A0A060HWB3_9ARCH|nr:hypothetical protein NVIE_030250 [Nitrososphaera viennensis EN76]